MIRQEYIHPEPFHCEAGGVIDPLHVVYHTSKESYAPGDKVIVICHALTANSDPSDWWSQLVGPGKLLDTQKYFILCVNMLTSPYGSSGPSSEGPDGRPYLLDFPLVTIRDMVAASILVRKHLGIDTIDFIVGSSIGGFQALEWTITESERFRNAIFMATAPFVSPWLVASVETQQMALEADRTFKEARSIEGGAAGLACARAQALMSYRCYDGYYQTQQEPDPDFIQAGRAASYQRYQGEKLVRRFDAYSYYYLGLALKSHNPGRGRGGLKAALASIKASTVVVGIDTDGLFPAQENRRMSALIPGAQYKQITSSFGHDGFLLEAAQVTEIIEPILKSL